MYRKTPWIRSLNAKLVGATLILLFAALTLAAANVYLLATVREDVAAMNFTSRGRALGYELLYLVRRGYDENPAARERTRRALDEAMGRFDERFRLLREGDPSRRFGPATDPRELTEIRDREEAWRRTLRPALERARGYATFDLAASEITVLEADVQRYFVEVDQGIELYQEIVDENARRFELLQYLFIAAVLGVFGVVLWLGRDVARRAGALATVAERIAGGELELDAAVRGSDELAVLGEAFNTMTRNLRRTIETETEARTRIERLLETVAETAQSLASSTTEILAGTTQQAAGTQEQAAAVAQTVTTVDEVAQTAEQAAQRARTVAEASQRAAETGRTGRRAVEDAVTGIGTVREQVESIAESILALAEQAQAIGEIIATVNDVAEQTNLLALNAAIEASRAGEQGRGFQVVAAEVKALADQAKAATAQVRHILGDIQKATHSAVMITEEGQKSVHAASRLVSEAGGTIKSLAETIAESAQAAAQIAASAGQQAGGMTQIHQAMQSISQATNQNLASTRQQEQAARDLNGLGLRLQELVAGYGG